MGCGSSSNAADKPMAVVVELSEADRNAIAVQGLKDALSWAATEAVALGKTAAVWQEEGVKIKVPCLDSIDKLKAKVSEVPVVGGQLAEKLGKATDPFEDQFANAAMTVCQESRTLDTFRNIIKTLDPNNAVYLCREGGVSACVSYLKDHALSMLREALTPVINSVMEAHPLTNLWKSAIEVYNMAAGKVSGIEELKFDLNEYVLTSALDAIMVLMMRKEKEIRDAPAQAVSWAIQQCFGSVDPSKWTKSKDG